MHAKKIENSNLKLYNLCSSTSLHYLSAECLIWSRGNFITILSSTGFKRNACTEWEEEAEITQTSFAGVSDVCWLGIAITLCLTKFSKNSAWRQRVYFEMEIWLNKTFDDDVDRAGK